MNRQEFIKQLEMLLLDISLAEREEALQYYNDYLDDAGIENEEGAIRALGSPAQVAANIKDGLKDGSEAEEVAEDDFPINMEAQSSAQEQSSSDIQQTMEEPQSVESQPAAQVPQSTQSQPAAGEPQTMEAQSFTEASQSMEKQASTEDKDKIILRFDEEPLSGFYKKDGAGEEKATDTEDVPEKREEENRNSNHADPQTAASHRKAAPEQGQGMPNQEQGYSGQQNQQTQFQGQQNQKNFSREQQYQGNQYQGNQHQGNQYQDSQYQNNNYRENNYQNNRYQGNQYQGNQSQGNQYQGNLQGQPYQSSPYPNNNQGQYQNQYHNTYQNQYQNTYQNQYQGSNQYQYQNQYGDSYGGACSRPPKKRRTAGEIVLFILICIFALPIIVPIGISILAVVFSLVVAVIAVLGSLVIAGLVILVVGIVLVIEAFTKLFLFPAGAIYLLGGGLICTGIGLAMTAGMVWVAAKVVPVVCRGFVKICRRPFTRRNAA